MIAHFYLNAVIIIFLNDEGIKLNFLSSAAHRMFIEKWRAWSVGQITRIFTLFIYSMCPKNLAEVREVNNLIIFARFRLFLVFPALLLCRWWLDMHETISTFIYLLLLLLLNAIKRHCMQCCRARERDDDRK